MRLLGKIAIISGAASGMGAATARMFVREGAKVVVLLAAHSPQPAVFPLRTI
jgi:NAD(P)-dependent dehydrogenase (short-subunit alcohol dehydrogenase family)